jgi:hypothetical protein
MIYIMGRYLLAISSFIISPGHSTAREAGDAGVRHGRRGDSPLHAELFRPFRCFFRDQNVTEFDMSAAGTAMVPLVLLVVLVFTIPPQLAMAVVLS